MGRLRRTSSEAVASSRYFDPELMARLQAEADMSGVLHANVSEVAEALRITEPQAAALLNQMAGVTVNPEAEKKRMMKIRRDRWLAFGVAFAALSVVVGAAAFIGWNAGHSHPYPSQNYGYAPSPVKAEPRYDIYIGNDRRSTSVDVGSLLDEVLNDVNGKSEGVGQGVPLADSDDVLALARAGKWDNLAFDRLTVRIAERKPYNGQLTPGRYYERNLDGTLLDPAKGQQWRVSVPSYSGRDVEVEALVKAEQAKRVKDLLTKIHRQPTPQKPVQPSNGE